MPCHAHAGPRLYLATLPWSSVVRLRRKEEEIFAQAVWFYTCTNHNHMPQLTTGGKIISPVVSKQFLSASDLEGLRMGVAYAFFDSYGGYETINQRVRSRPVVPNFGLEVFH